MKFLQVDTTVQDKFVLILETREHRSDDQRLRVGFEDDSFENGFLMPQRVLQMQIHQPIELHGHYESNCIALPVFGFS